MPEDYEYDVLINYESDKPFFVLPGDALTFTMEVHPSGKDKPPIEINLHIDFREPFTSDAVVVISARADVNYPKILYPKDGEKADV